VKHIAAQGCVEAASFESTAENFEIGVPVLERALQKGPVALRFDNKSEIFG
jgi:hypothetical protein